MYSPGLVHDEDSSLHPQYTERVQQRAEVVALQEMMFVQTRFPLAVQE